MKGSYQTNRVFLSIFAFFHRFILICFFLLFSHVLFIYPQDFDARGEDQMAERYALWAKNMMNNGQWKEALAGLERAADFANVSSDLSYLLAVARSHEKMPRLSVLEALELALVTDAWNEYSPDTARLMKAENLIIIRAYADALKELSRVPASAEEAALTLKALMGSPAQFRAFLTATLDRYPREIAPVRIFFDFLKKENSRNWEIDSEPMPTAALREDLELLDLINHRLPVLLLKDPELAWMAAPYMRDRDEARRLVLAYRAIYTPLPASLPVSLHLGVIDDETALEELFKASLGKPVIDIDLLAEIWGLLRREETRALFRRNLSSYTGVIIEDRDRDTIHEVSAEYFDGMITAYHYDANQDGVPELSVQFDAALPVRAEVAIPPDTSRENPAGNAAVQWERYPAIQEVELDGVQYIPRPLDFHYSPLRFVDFNGSGFLFPLRDPLGAPLTRRVLVSNSIRVERPSLEFRGGMEVVEVNQGIPVRAREYVGNMMVSETEFLRGRPQLQRVDLDFDGHMETVRHFSRNYRDMELEELWNYDRNVDYTYNQEGDGN